MFIPMAQVFGANKSNYIWNIQQKQAKQWTGSLREIMILIIQKIQIKIKHLTNMKKFECAVIVIAMFPTDRYNFCE